MNPDATSSSNQPPAQLPPASGRNQNVFWQFSLQSLLLIALATCLLAGYLRERWAHVTEYRRRLDAERGHLVQRDKLRSIQIQQKLLDPPSRTLAVADPKLVYVKAEQGGIGSREGNAWQWTIYLPPDKRDWWLYISQGSKWDAVQGKYVDGAISGSQFKTGREQSLWGCISYDREGGAYIQIWSADGCQTARMSDAGYATFRGSPDAARITAGETEQEALSPATSPRGRMQLFRWHRVSADATSEYGFSIYLVDESPPGR